MAGRSRLKGIARFRRLLRRMPESVQAEIVSVLRLAEPRILAVMMARAPRRTGALVGGLKSRLLETTMRLRVGFIGLPKGRARLFYARILEFGRKAQTVTVFRRRQGAPKRLVRSRKPKEDIVTPYQLRVSPLAPRRTVTGSMPVLRQEITSRLKGLFTRALSRIAGGSDV